MLVEPGINDQFLVSVMAFGLEAETNFTQVLFFKFLANDVTFRHFSGKLTIDSEVLANLRLLITEKVLRYAHDYVKAIVL